MENDNNFGYEKITIVVEYKEFLIFTQQGAHSFFLL